MSKPVAKDLHEEEALRDAIDALRADNGRLLRLLIAGFVSDGRPEHKELTEGLAHYPNFRNWLGTGALRILDANQNQVTQMQNNDHSSAGQTMTDAFKSTLMLRVGRGRPAKWHGIWDGFWRDRSPPARSDRDAAAKLAFYPQ